MEHKLHYLEFSFLGFPIADELFLRSTSRCMAIVRKLLRFFAMLQTGKMQPMLMLCLLFAAALCLCTSNACTKHGLIVLADICIDICSALGIRSCCYGNITADALILWSSLTWAKENPWSLKLASQCGLAMRLSTNTLTTKHVMHKLWLFVCELPQHRMEVMTRVVAIRSNTSLLFLKLVRWRVLSSSFAF